MIFAEVLLSDGTMNVIGSIVAGSLLAILGAGILMFVRMGTLETKLQVMDASGRDEKAERVGRQRDLDEELEKIYDRLNRTELAVARLETQLTAFTTTVGALNAAVSALARVIDRVEDS